MNNTSKIFLNKITDTVVIDILKIVIPTLLNAKIEYFIVGAFARDIDLLALGHNELPKRKTKDIDLAVMMDSKEGFEAFRQLILQLEDFTEDSEQPYKFLFRDAYEIDFIPFGAIENEKGQVEIIAKRTFILEIPGFDEVLPTVQTIITDEINELRVSSLAGVVFLKLLAWQDRPERTKDIEDIRYILQHFLFLNYELISQEEDDIMAYYTEEIALFEYMVAARFIGRQIQRMLENSPQLRNRLIDLLSRESQDAATSKMARLLEIEDLEDSVSVIRQLYLGIFD